MHELKIREVQDYSKFKDVSELYDCYRNCQFKAILMLFEYSEIGYDFKFLTFYFALILEPNVRIYAYNFDLKYVDASF